MPLLVDVEFHSGTWVRTEATVDLAGSDYAENGSLTPIAGCADVRCPYVCWAARVQTPSMALISDHERWAAQAARRRR